MSHLIGPFFIFFSRTKAGIKGHMTQIFDILSEHGFEVIKFNTVAKLETVSVTLLKVMTVFRFSVNEALSHALTLFCLGFF